MNARATLLARTLTWALISIALLYVAAALIFRVELRLAPLPSTLAGLVALGVAVTIWIPFVRSLTRPVREMTEATEGYAKGRFDVAVQEDGAEEIARLGQAINHMAKRLKGFVRGQRRFLGDIAHELCSPVARIQLALGILEQRADPSLRKYVDDLQQEVQEMSELLSELMSFSKTGLGTQQIKLHNISVSELAQQVAQREAPEGVTVTANIDEKLTVVAEPKLADRALGNLVRNAVRYAGDAGPIEISAERVEGFVLIHVSDSGPGVPDESVDQLFDPFYRIEEARDRETGGTGLGMAIVQACVESCAGTVTARNREPRGFVVTLKLHTRQRD